MMNDIDFPPIILSWQISPFAKLKENFKFALFEGAFDRCNLLF